MNRVYSRARLWRILEVRKKFTLAPQMGRKDKYFFAEIKVFKNITDDKIDMIDALYFEIYSL